MKKVLATILAVSTAALAITACDVGGGKKPNPFGDDDDETRETTEEVRPIFELDSLPKVDATESFGEYHVKNFDEAWGVNQNLRMSDGAIRNFFCDYAFDSYDRQVNENLNFVATMSRPTVTVFDADKDGYIVYEVVYTQVFPIASKEPGNVYKSFFSYHGVGYIDFYTGATFPCINLSTQIDSFSVTGTVVYQGKSYDVAYYEYRQDEFSESSTTATNDGYYIKRTNVEITTTSYFVVPDGYDGIMMYVYVANDTDRPIEEVLADDNPYFEEPGFFGDDENIDDYVFIGIQAPK
ncbi:MAG: hypothetical protein IKO15_00775 [Clostridiales bacterium]|nr:hypothetical protein [Clostridiales bacterium]